LIDRSWLVNIRYQLMAALVCLLFGAAMIANIELGGEASWYWYATLMHQGIRLYADLHMPLQPFYALETEGWLRLVGRACLRDEALALIHVILLIFGMALVLRESSWPDWRKAAILLAAFFTDIFFLAIRFDDFHVVNDILALFTIVVLLRLYHSKTASKDLLWTIVAGVLCGLSFTNRSTDGGMLLLAGGLCVPFLAKRRRRLCSLLYAASVLAALLFIVHLTGDTLHDYLANSVFHAASAKGGAGTVLRGPFLAVLDNLKRLITRPHWLCFPLMFAAAAYARRRWRDDPRRVVTASLGCGLLVWALLTAASHGRTTAHGDMVAAINLIVQNLMYPLCVLVVLHFLLTRHDAGHLPWDPREILLFIPAALLVSAAVSQANGTTNSTVSLMVAFLLSTFWLPIGGKRRWLTDTWIAIALIVACAGFLYKAYTPYAWNAYLFKPMFVGRQVYHHPVYGPMYLQKDLLQFIEPLCKEIQQPDGRAAELLSMPYSYPNYFCATQPWHGYVQTWFDTTTPEAVQVLMNQLAIAPPQWIVYERQLSVLHAHEVEYNGGRPIMHRKLDELIASKIASGQWKVVDKRDYPQGEPWYVIKTRP
jgi:hypothetical protein